MRRTTLSFACSLIVFTSTACAWGAEPTRPFLVVLSDTDMVPTVYETGDLGPVDPKHRDTLSLIALPFDEARAAVAVEVSNSTNGPPGALGVSNDGSFAYVAETYRQRPQGATRLDQLPQGNVVRSVDLRAPDRPTVIDTAEIGTQPQTAELSPSGDLIAAVTVDADHELAFVPVKNGRFGAVARFGLDLPQSSGFIPLKSTWVQWHPSGRYVAVNLVDRAQIAFYEVVRGDDGSVSAVRPWGNRVQSNKFPFVGRFSPDGRFYITSDIQWGIDTEGFYGVQEGILTTVRLADVGSTGDEARHVVPHIALGPWGAETLVFSPDGRFLVTANLRGTGKPDGDRHLTENASVSLYELDAESGRLTQRGEWPFEAVLPQGLAFDPTGSTLFVGVNRYRNEEAMPGGAVEVWRLVTEGTPRLERTPERVRLPAGVHTLAVR
jgi:6-phosphogluconolactonase (cycloisomerase 2 family)